METVPSDWLEFWKSFDKNVAGQERDDGSGSSWCLTTMMAAHRLKYADEPELAWTMLTNQS